MKPAYIGLCVVLGILVFVPGCAGLTALSSYNAFQRRDEQVKRSWAQVLSVYQKRADLIPDLVETVKGYATHEERTLSEVANARASVGKLQIPADAKPEDLQRFAAAQRDLSGALARLLVVSESNPNLKADQGFLRLQTQLSEIQSQATAARNRYTREVEAFNINVRSFPSNMIAGFFGYGVKPQLQFEDEAAIKKSPHVKF